MITTCHEKVFGIEKFVSKQRQNHLSGKASYKQINKSTNKQTNKQTRRRR
jgi:hypothetical protein